MTRALIVCVLISACFSTTADAADDTVYFWSCSGEEGLCYTYFICTVNPSTGRCSGSASLTTTGSCTVSPGQIEATETVAASACLSWVISGNVTGWAGYVTNMPGPDKLGYVISEGTLYDNGTSPPSVIWEGWYRRYCDGQFVKNEPPAVPC